MQKTIKVNNDKSMPVVKYMRTATLEQTQLNDELSASQQIDEIEAFAQAQGAQVQKGKQ